MLFSTAGFRKVYLLLMLPALLSVKLLGQDIFQNPSFEGIPQPTIPPPTWINCGNLSTPDTQPGSFDVDTPPKEGYSYLGLVCRSNGTHEAVHQQLLHPLLPDGCYSFTIHLARSPTYFEHNTPAVLRIWGSTQACERQELLWTSSSVEHTDWQEYRVELRPKQKHTYILLEAYFAGPTYYNGNVMIDFVKDQTSSVIPPESVKLGRDTTLCEGEALLLSLPNEPGWSYHWQDNTTADQYSVTFPGTYWVRVQQGCKIVTDTIRVYFKQCYAFEVPNVFTPNGDGVNETFEVKGILLAKWELSIFNRYGSRIYFNSAYRNDWNGDELPTGTYFYYLQDKDSPRRYKGWVHILR